MHTLPINPSAPEFLAKGKASIRNLPVSLFAAVMGLCGLALCWRLAHRSLAAPAFVGEAIGALALFVFVLMSVGYVAKLTKYPRAVQAEFLHPMASSFFNTIAISLLLLSTIVAPYSAPAAHALWVVGALAAVVLSFLAISRLLKGQVDASHAVPAWLISGVAPLNIPATGGHMPMAWAAEVSLVGGAIGLVLAFVLFAMIFSRLVHREPFPLAMTPSLMILVAPFGVGFLAYIHIVGSVDRCAALLFYFGLFMFAMVAPKVFRPSVRFSPGWWAIGFPMAALVNAALRYADFLASGPLLFLAGALLSALSLALAILTVRTVKVALSGELFT